MTARDLPPDRHERSFGAASPSGAKHETLVTADERLVPRSPDNQQANEEVLPLLPNYPGATDPRGDCPSCGYGSSGGLCSSCLAEGRVVQYRAALIELHRLAEVQTSVSSSTILTVTTAALIDEDR